MTLRLRLTLLYVALLGAALAATIARSTESVETTLETGEIASTLGISNMIFKDFVYPFEPEVFCKHRFIAKAG